MCFSNSYEENVNFLKISNTFPPFQLQCSVCCNGKCLQDYLVCFHLKANARKHTPHILCMPFFIDKIWGEDQNITLSYSLSRVLGLGDERPWMTQVVQSVFESMLRTSENDSVGSQPKPGRAFQLSVQNQANMY